MSKSIYVSPSTQENNVGACNYGTEEVRMNQVADVVVRELKRHSVTVYRNRPEMSLGEVVRDSNAKSPTLHFAIHSNAGGNGKARGGEVFCHKFGGTGEKMARNVYEELEPLTPTKDRGVLEGANFYGPGKPMYELAYTDAPAALVEIDFHDSADGAAWIISHIEAIGVAIAKGLLKTLGITWQAPAQPKPKEPTAQEIAVDAALAAGLITDREHWLQVLTGKVPANPEYLTIAFTRAKGLRKG